ncbi:MAG: hypothetical protein WCK90_05070, partial [archaeon]
MTKKITLEYIKETRPNVYAELCLEVGDKESALEIYEKTNPFRAAELALELNRYQQANTLADKALKFSKEILEDAQRYAKETAEAGMGGGL